MVIAAFVGAAYTNCRAKGACDGWSKVRISAARGYQQPYAGATKQLASNLKEAEANCKCNCCEDALLKVHHECNLYECCTVCQ
jgi:hypothetical protein